MNIPKYTEEKEIEMFFNFNNTQILRINTNDPETFLNAGEKFFYKLKSLADVNGKVKIIYVVDKLPPLSSIMSFVSLTYPSEVKWSVIAAIAPTEIDLLNKFVPIVTYGLNLTDLRGKYVLNIFNHKYKYDLKNIFEWLDQNSNDQAIGGLVTNT